MQSSILKRLYWQLTALLLALHLVASLPHALALALALTVWQCAHFLWHRRALQAFDVQVRTGFLVLLLVGAAPYAGMVHWLVFLGVNAMLVADYCPMARLLVLLPWNRQVPLSGALLRWLLFSAPAPGPIHQRVPTTFAPQAGSTASAG